MRQKTGYMACRLMNTFISRELASELLGSFDEVATRKIEESRKCLGLLYVMFTPKKKQVLLIVIPWWYRPRPKDR